MPPEPYPDQEEDYASSEDSDFAPEEVAERDVTPSDDGAADAPDQPAPTGKRKRQAGDTEAEDAGFENSGDEAIIGKGKKRLKKSKRKDALDDDEGGEGGLIKTRSQRAQEKVEKKYAIAKGPVTIDVDALWQQMLNDAPAPATSTTQDGPPKSSQDGANTGVEQSPSKQARQDGGIATGQQKEAPALIRIKRTYNFAGKVHTEEKLVARDSAEAKVYLASLGEDADPDALAVEEDQQPPKKMPRKAFRSIFEPITEQLLQRSDLNLGMGVRLKAREQAAQANAKKLNTVEKSRMDWAGYVDKEGIKDDLVLAGKSKTSYAARQDFLARSEAVREEEARRARLAGKV